MPPSDYAYGQGAVPPRKSGMTTPGKVIFFVGLLLTLVAVAVAVWGVVTTVRTASTMEADSVMVQDSVTVPMEGDQVRLILADSGTSPSCTVTGPDGADVPVTQDPAFDAAAEGGVVVIGTFTSEQAGDHTVSCDSPAKLSPALGLQDAVGLVAAGIAFLALFPLVLITLLGLILWLVGRSRDKKAALAASGYGGPGGYPGTPAGGYGTAGGAYGASQTGGYGQAGDQGQPSDYGQGQPGGYGTGQGGADPYGTPQDPPPSPGSGGWQSAPPPPPPSSSPTDPYAAPEDRPEEGRGDQR